MDIVDKSEKCCCVAIDKFLRYDYIAICIPGIEIGK